MPCSNKLAISTAILLVFIPIFILSISVGAVDISIDKILETFHYFFINKTMPAGASANIILNFRLPRSLIALLVGAGLSLSGIIMQSITQNDLADPYILGISSGASAGAVIAIVLNLFSVYIGAFCGALLACLLVFIIFSWDKDKSATKIVLIGVAVSALFNAINTYVITTADNAEKVRNAAFWAMGSLGGARWHIVPALAIVVLLASFIAFLFHNELDGLALGDDQALLLGYPVEIIRKSGMLLVTLLMAVMVSKTGIIGFVGLVVPHIARLFVGKQHKKLIPAGILIGSFLMLCADTLCRVIIKPQEMPIGVITAFMGAPFFIWILKKKGNAYD